MKNKMIAATLVLLAISLNGFTQTKKDSLPAKRDTVVLLERTDTLRFSFICTFPTDNTVKYVENGYVVVKGLSTSQNKPYQWSQAPTITYAFDDKKRPVKKIIQIY